MIQDIERRLRQLEEWMRDSYYDTRHQVRSELYQRNRMDIQQTGCPHMFTALCVNTLDPMAEGQVQYYTPYNTLPGTQVGGLPWAYPVSTFGGFDDSGVSWVPPAGSKLALFFENGDVNQAYYFGTVWPSTRGIANSNQQEQSDIEMPTEDDNRLDMWGYQIPEYECFVGDTDVITLSGVKFIRDVEVGDYVLTHTNRYRKVISKSQRKFKDFALKIETYGSNKDVICTPEHPFYVTSYNQKRGGVKYEWKKACDLKDDLIITKLRSDQRTVAAKIRSVEKIEINEDVYNLEVEVDHSYTANGRIVHNCVWEGTRDGYNLGSNRGDQVKMPWNTDNYQIQDWDTRDDFQANPEANQFITYPHIHGFKTPGKHYSKYQDGDHKCNEKWSHVEHATGRGIIFMMKDDHLHHAVQWAFNGETGNDASQCHTPLQSDFSECTKPNEKTDCEDPNNPDNTNQTSTDGEQQSNADKVSNSSIDKDEFANPFFKRKEEMRFYKAVDALAEYQNPKCELKQSGFQLQSLSGIQIVADDSVDQPQGIPNWKLDFDWGCNDIAKCKYFVKSATGHIFEMDDAEDDTLIRGESNGIKLRTATGISLEMLDHTLGDKENPEEAGEKRGFFVRSSSRHVFEMHDEGNQQHSLPRQHPPIDEKTGEQEDITVSKADKAYILLRSGYGIQIRIDDSTSQENTVNQYLQLLSPQKDNELRGPHQMVFQEEPEGPGLVMLRAGGVYYRSSFDDAIEVVGDENNPEPSNKFVQVTGKYIVDAEDYYFNHNDLTVFQAEKYVILFAGRDCPIGDNPADTAANANQSALGNAQIAAESNALGQPNQFPLNKGPCLFPVVVGKDPFVCPFTNFIHYGIMSDPADPTHTKLLYNSLSDRVFASASQDQETQNAEAQNGE